MAAALTEDQEPDPWDGSDLEAPPEAEVEGGEEGGAAA